MPETPGCPFFDKNAEKKMFNMSVKGFLGLDLTTDVFSEEYK